MSIMAHSRRFFCATVLGFTFSCSAKQEATARNTQILLSPEEQRAVQLAENHILVNGYTDQAPAPGATSQPHGTDRKREIVLGVRRNTLKRRAFGLSRADEQTTRRRWVVVFEFTDQALMGELSRAEVGQAVVVDLDDNQVQVLDKAFVLASVQKRVAPPSAPNP